MKTLLAQVPQPLGNFEGIGPLGNWTIVQGDVSTPAALFTRIISLTISLITAIAFIWFSINLIIAAIGWLADRGDEKHVAESRKRITSSVIGLVLTISSIFLIKLIGFIFGIDILDLTSIIINLSP